MMNTERLMKMVWLLRNIREERKVIDHGITKFNMEVFHCGTAACAVGHAMYHPWFNKEGLVPANTYGSTPRYREELGMEAVRRFFSIGHGSASYLFGSDLGWMRPREVANRIERYVQNGGLHS